MGSDSSNEYNRDISIKGDINIYICGKINSNSGLEGAVNYEVLKNLFNVFVDNGKIRAENYMNNIYPYEYRKLDKKMENTQIKGKNYNAFLFFNEVNEIFSKILIEEHLYDMDTKNSNKNIIIYFGENEYIKESFDRLYQKSKETLPFLIIVKDISNYNEDLKFINYIPSIKSINKLLMSSIKNYNKCQMKLICQKVLFNFIITKIYRMDMYYNQLGYNLNMINPFNEINCKIKVHLTIGLVGYSGCGKSTLINILFNQLVCRVSSSATDVTTKCSEYYLPVNVDSDNVGQIRFLDFPGINNETIYYDIVEPEINKKIKEYKKNREQIDLVLFYIPNGVGRELNNTGLELIKLLHSNKIKILFIINGEIKPLLLEDKKSKLKNEINNNKIFKNIKEKNGILNDDFSNLINTDYYQFYNIIEKTGIPLILEKIIDIINIKDKNFCIEDITVDNYNEKLEELKNINRLFELYKNMSDLKDSIRIKSKLVVVEFSALAFGTSALSIVVPLVDAAAAIGYQVAMVYRIFSLYELDTRDYKIKDIILSGGNSIELEDEYKQKDETNNNDNNNKEKDESNNEVIFGNIREGLSDVGKAATFIGKEGVKYISTKEAGKIIVEKSVETVIGESIKKGAIKASFCTLEASVEKAAVYTVSTSVEKIALESSKELVEQGIKEGAKITIEATKDTLIAVSKEGAETAIEYGTKESIKTVTESIVIQQGGKTWLINLGKAVPFIGAGISAIMNTFSTAKIGHKLVTKLDEEFENNRQRKVDILRGKVLGIYNIIEQIKYLIKIHSN